VLTRRLRFLDIIKYFLRASALPLPYNLLLHDERFPLPTLPRSTRHVESRYNYVITDHHRYHHRRHHLRRRQWWWTRRLRIRLWPSGGATNRPGRVYSTRTRGRGRPRKTLKEIRRRSRHLLRATVRYTRRRFVCIAYAIFTIVPSRTIKFWPPS